MKRRGQLAFLLPLSLLFLVNVIYASIPTTKDDQDLSTTPSTKSDPKQRIIIKYRSSALDDKNALEKEGKKVVLEHHSPIVSLSKDDHILPMETEDDSKAELEFLKEQLERIKSAPPYARRDTDFKIVMEQIMENKQMNKPSHTLSESEQKEFDEWKEKMKGITLRSPSTTRKTTDLKEDIDEILKKLKADDVRKNFEKQLKYVASKSPQSKTKLTENTNKTFDQLEKNLRAALKMQANIPTMSSKSLLKTMKPVHYTKLQASTTESSAMQELVDAEIDVAYNDNDKLFNDDEEDDDDDDDDDDDEEYDEDDDDDDDEDSEEIMLGCPDYCRCTGQGDSGLTARCSKLVMDQNFGSKISHLLIENAGEITLGPLALKSHNLIHLETLKIINTRVSHIDRTAFDGVPYLFSVNLSQCGIIDMHPDTFQNNTKLSLLTISGHPYWRNWTVHKSYLFNSSAILEFDFSWNSFPYLPNTAFEKMPNLAYLNLRNNRLGAVNRSMFKPLLGLAELDLTANLLSDESLSAFDGLSIQTLKLVENSFTSLQNLKPNEMNFLDISKNHIKRIGNDDLNGLKTLEQLILSGNELKFIHQHALSQLIELNHLDLSKNNLMSINENHFKKNAKLQVLILNDNPNLGTLPIFKTVDYNYNSFNIFRFECANCGLKKIDRNTFNSMTALTELNLARNKLVDLPDGMFVPLSTLRKLDLSDNKISFMSPNMFKGAYLLTKLNLAGNPLVSLQVTPFLNTPELSRLDVSRCQLSRIWSEARQPLKSLRFLSVRNNKLEHIEVEELKAMPKLSGLDVFQNKLICDNEFKKTIRYLIAHAITPMETTPYVSNFRDDDSHHMMVSYIHWPAFTADICDDEGPPPRRPAKLLPEYDDAIASERSKQDLEEDSEEKDIYQMNNADQTSNPTINWDMGEDAFGNRIFNADRTSDPLQDWDLNIGENTLDDDMMNEESIEGLAWTDGISIWSILIGAMVILALTLILFQLVRCMVNRRGRGPVIRPPLILRQGLVDNKNCGLVYKPLHEEIPTPQTVKRGSFYSSSTFHYDKIVPEKV